MKLSKILGEPDLKITAYLAFINPAQSETSLHETACE